MKYVLLALLLMSGCVVYAHRHPRYYEPVPAGCNHHDACGHYYWNGRWYHAERHVHGSGCGHVWVNDRWTYCDDNDDQVRYVRVEERHVCHDRCDHCWEDDHWIVIRGHRHGPGCGHLLYGGRWVVHRAVAVDPHHHCHNHCDHYWHGDRWYVIYGHRHGPGCGHFWDGGRWCVR